MQELGDIFYLLQCFEARDKRERENGKGRILGEGLGLNVACLNGRN